MSRSHILLFFFCLSLQVLNADTGETGANFLTLDAGARSIGMGGAVSSLNTGADALFWNPGGMNWFQGTEILFAHSEYLQSIRHEHFGIVHHFPFANIGFSVKGMFVSGLEERTGPSQNPISTFTCYALAPAYAMTFSLGKKVGFGVNIKTIFQTYGSDNALAFGGDAGMSVRDILGGMRFGAVLNNIGTGVKFVNTSYPLPTSVTVGLGYAGFSDRFMIGADVNKLMKDDMEWRIGMAATVFDKVTLRIGYRSALDVEGTISGFTAGTGFNIGDIGIDYAVASFGELGLTHSLSIGYALGATRTTQEDEDRIAAELEKRAKLTAETFYAQGVANQNVGKYEDALRYYDIALIWYPDYNEAIQAAKSVQKRIEAIKVNEFLTRGIAEYNSGRYIEAILEFGNILEIDSTHQQAREWMNASTNAMVQMHMQKVQHEQAIQAQIEDYLKRGLAYYSKGKFKEAMQEWNKIIAMDPTHQEAQEYISKALAQMARQIQNYLTNTQTYMNQKKWMEANSEVNKALILEPKNQNALAKKSTIQKELRELSISHTQEGIRLYKQKQYAAAETEFKMALHYEANNVTAKEYLDKMKPQEKAVSGGDINELYMKGVNAYTQGKYQVAIVYWKRVLEIDPNHSNAQRNILRAEEKLKINK